MSIPRCSSQTIEIFSTARPKLWLGDYPYRDSKKIGCLAASPSQATWPDAAFPLIYVLFVVPPPRPYCNCLPSYVYPHPAAAASQLSGGQRNQHRILQGRRHGEAAPPQAQARPAEAVPALSAAFLHGERNIAGWRSNCRGKIRSSRDKARGERDIACWCQKTVAKIVKLA